MRQVTIGSVVGVVLVHCQLQNAELRKAALVWLAEKPKAIVSAAAGAQTVPMVLFIGA